MLLGNLVERNFAEKTSQKLEEISLHQYGNDCDDNYEEEKDDDGEEEHLSDGRLL